MALIERTVRASDGRTLLFEEGGDPTGRPVFVLAGTPNSRHLFGPHSALAADEDPEAARKKTLADRETMLGASPEGIREFMQTLLSPVDAAVLTGEFAEHLARNTRDGLAPGIQGWWDDGWAMLQPWAFELATIRVPLMLWHGRHDRFVPFSHGEWLARQIPGADVHLSDDDGHLTLTQRRLPAIHQWLLEHF
ncbi:MAG: hypothetical protein ABI401_11610 [Candidatus Dormibacter sp.]